MRIADRGLRNGGDRPLSRRVRRLRRPEQSNAHRVIEPTNRSDARFSLAQIVHHTLKRPVVRMFDQPMADGVVSNVQSFHVAGLIAPHLPVPKAPLPNRAILLSRPAPGDVGLSRANPTV
jgi:hypothetical protein